MLKILKNKYGLLIIGILVFGSVAFLKIIQPRFASTQIATLSSPTPSSYSTEAPLFTSTNTPVPVTYPVDKKPTTTPKPTIKPTSTPKPTITPTPTPIQKCANNESSTTAPNSGQSSISGGTVRADGSSQLTFTVILKDNDTNLVQGAYIGPINSSGGSVSFDPAFSNSDSTNDCGQAIFNATSTTPGTFTLTIHVTLGNGSTSDITPQGSITFTSS